jgi:amino acid transporter
MVALGFCQATAAVPVMYGRPHEVHVAHRCQFSKQEPHGSKLMSPHTAVSFDTKGNPGATQLRRSCLSYTEILAQSVSVIAPSTVPAAVLGLIFARAGNATWLSFVLGIFGLVLVSLNINQFARRSASPGSLYSYIVQGLGPTAGVLGGLALLLGYTLTGMSTLCGLALITNVLLAQWFGFQLPVVLLFAVGVLGSFYIAFRDIQLSAKTMLYFEGLSLLSVLVLGVIIWSSKDFAVDTAQLTLEGATPSGALVAVVLVVFGFSGFESSTALGAEAKKPLVNIPRSILQSVVLAGLFFTVMTYIVVLGFKGTGMSLAESEAPLHTLANSIGWGGLGTAINIGILLSFFSCTLASINSSARILFSMANHGLIPDALGQAHVQNRTPHVAVGLAALATFSVPTALYLGGIGAFASQGYFGTLCSFGFIVVYMLISLAAPAYLASVGRLNGRAIAYSAGGIGFMLLPVIGIVGIPGSELLPTPDGEGVVLLSIFAVYMAAGLGWLLFQRIRHPNMIAQMRSAVQSVELQFAQREARSDMDIYLSRQPKVSEP